MALIGSPEEPMDSVSGSTDRFDPLSNPHGRRLVGAEPDLRIENKTRYWTAVARLQYAACKADVWAERKRGLRHAGRRWFP